MKQLVNKLILIATCLVFLGCAGIQLIEDRKIFKKTTVISDYSSSVYVPYLRYSTTPVDMDSVCKNREWKDVYISPTFLGGLISVITVGFVHPQEIQARCSN